MADIALDADAVLRLAAALFEAHGTAPDDARELADMLVSADLEGVASHGCALIPMYLERIVAGSVLPSARPRGAEAHGALIAVDAGHGLGSVSSRFAVAAAVEAAREHGVALVSVRHAFHFGAGAYWARRIAAQGMIGCAFSNTRPLMPAPGGAQRVVGNNPLSIAFPSGGDPLVVDMATSASAMGKIRNAAAQGKAIPSGWATDDQGHDTTDPQAAIAGMLLPTGGPKGFGLAVAIDLLCGALSGGAVGKDVRPLYGDPAVPYDCAHAFIAIDAARANAGQGIAAQVARFAQDIRDSARAPGVDRIHAPGDLERARRQAARGRCAFDDGLVRKLNALAEQAGVPQRL